ncbi:hypothetical protein [Gemmatimonas sp.]
MAAMGVMVGVSPRLTAQTVSPVAMRTDRFVLSEATPLALRRPAVATSAAVFTAPAGPPAPWWAPVASAVVPGSGQFALKQQRSVAYLVAEAFLLVQYMSARRDGNRERDAYRALAVDVARKAFGGTQQGSWEYYETLEQFLESGAYDRVPGGALDPETDPTTYNGFRWRLARETYWLNPDVAPAVGSAEYQRALDFYQRNAVSDAFRWSWRDAQLEQNVYVETIRSANRSYQRAVNMLGVVAVNHLASLIDAYVSVRVRRYGGVSVAGYAVDGVQVRYVPTEGGTTLQTGVRLVR